MKTAIITLLTFWGILLSPPAWADYQHGELGSALGWKYNHQPGIQTKDGKLTVFPSIWPTDTEQAQIVSEYLAYKASSLAKDDKLQQFLDSDGGRAARAIVNTLVSKGIVTMTEIKAAYQALQ